MELSKYLAMVDLSERNLADAFILVGDRHDRNSEIQEQCNNLAAWSHAHRERLAPFIAKYGEDKSNNPQVEMVRGALFHGVRIGEPGLLADLQDLALLTNQTLAQWTAVHQAAIALHDQQMETASEECCEQTDRQLSWLKTHIQTAAPQALTVPSEKRSELAASLPKRQTPSTQQEIVWAPLAGGALMLVVGGVALLAGLLMGMPAGYPWLFPSLGPTAYLQAASPALPTARFYNVVVGHGVGLLAGFGAVFLLNAYQDPAALVAHELTWGRAVAVAVALTLTLLLALLLKASHPPAGATTLLVALGTFKIEDIPSVIIGVLIVAAAGELVRRARLGHLTARRERREERLPAPKPKPQG
jgi:hypothetical protein